MKVLMEAIWWADGPPSGARVARGLATGWLSVFPDDQLTVLVPHGVDPGIPHVTTTVRQQALAATVAIPRIAADLDADVVITHNFTPLWGPPSVPFIHDVLFQEFPQWFTRSERAYMAAIPRLARRAPLVLTSSQNEADRIARLNPRVGPVKAIGLGMDGALETADPQRPPGLIGDEFLLSVGRMNARKNLDFAIRAALASGTVHERRPLIVVGEQDGAQAAWSPEVRHAIADGLVVLLGHVTTPQLSWLYRNAAVLIYLSLDEGFGLPPLEAAAFGTRTVASDRPVFREVANGLTTFADPQDLTGAAAAIKEAVDAPRQTPVPPPSWEEVVTRARASLEDVG